MAERRNKSLVIPLSTGATLLVSGFLAGGQHVPVHIQLGPGPLLGFRDRPAAADLRRLPLRPGSLERFRLPLLKYNSLCLFNFGFQLCKPSGIICGSFETARRGTISEQFSINYDVCSGNG